MRIQLEFPVRAFCTGLLLIAAALMGTTALGQSNEWTWMGGSNLPNQSGVYGTLGVSAPDNIPGAVPPSGSGRAVGWTDKNGNLWVFGAGGNSPYFNTWGATEDGVPNDLWEFNPSTNQWTWMGGSSTISGCDYYYGCGIPGVYGTLGVPAAGNFPGSRWGASSWTDPSGNLWLFGGAGHGACCSLGNGPDWTSDLNDLWKFNPSTNEWAWMSGSSTSLYIGSSGYRESGVYGTLGVPAASNVPGGRYYASTWTDKAGNLWLFGGQGYDGTNLNVGYLNDLWKFDLSTHEWTWMSGSSSLGACTGSIGQCGVPGVYGVLGTPGAGNTPGSRSGAASWTDASGNLWLFGGIGYDAAGTFGDLNDLWKYDPNSNQWTWIRGVNNMPCKSYQQSGSTFQGVFCGQLSINGILGVSSPGNAPGGRSPVASWTDSSGNFWLFGGIGLDASGQFTGNINDLWYFNPSTKEWVWMGGGTEAGNCVSGDLYVNCGDQPGSYGVLGTAALGNLPGSRINAVSLTDNSGNFWLFSGSENPAPFIALPMNDVWMYTPSATTLPAAVTPQFSSSSGVVYSGVSVSISNGMTNGSIYFTTDGSIPTASSTLYTGPITVTASQTIQAIAIAPGYQQSGVGVAHYTVEVPVATPVLSVPQGTYNSVQTLTITDEMPGATILYAIGTGSAISGWTPYTGPITVSSTEVVWAQAQAAGYLASPIVSAIYTIDLPLAASPTFSLPAGTYSSSQQLTISDGTPGAAIYYTLDGTTPTSNSILYNQPIAISTSETVMAIAVASGYANSPATVAHYTMTLSQPSFTLHVTPTSLTISRGGTGKITLTVTPLGGFSSAVNFACSGMPSGTTCSFNPSTVTPTGSSMGTTLTVTAPSQVAARLPGLPWAALALMLCSLGWKRKRIEPWLVLLVACAVFGLVSACGGGTSGGITDQQPVTGTGTVTATSGSLQQKATFTLTVN